MRILINASVVGHIMNGFSVYCLGLLRELLPLLRARGYKVELILSRGSILEELDVQKMYLPDICGTPRKRSPINPICRLLYNFFVLPFRVHPDDIVYSMTPHGLAWGPGKQIMTLHDLIPLEFPAQHRFQYHYTRWLLPLMLHHAEKIICISDTTRQILLKKMREPVSKTTVIYNGCGEDFHPCETAVEMIAKKYGVRDYLLAIGVGFPHKNVGFMIENYGKLPIDVCKKHPLMVVGINTDPYAQSLMAMAKTLPSAEYIHFAGMVPQADLPAMYAAARLFVYPTFSEGFGMPPVEAIHCGTPCIVSDLPILREVLGMANEKYFNPKDEASLLASLENELAKEKSVADVEKYVQKYSWKVTAQQTLSVIESLR